MLNADIEGLRTFEELDRIIRLQIYLAKIKEAITEANRQSALLGILRPDGEPVRLADSLSLSLMCNDLSMIARAHALAEDRVAEAAFDALEARAA